MVLVRGFTSTLASLSSGTSWSWSMQVGDLVRLIDGVTIALIVERSGLAGGYRLASNTDPNWWVLPVQIKEVVSARR